MSLGVCFIELVVTVMVIVTYIDGDNNSYGDGYLQRWGDGVGDVMMMNPTQQII
jgi:hypothetical protein